MVYDKNKSPVGWYYGSYLLRFVELDDVKRNNPERRFASWENTVIVEARTLNAAFAKVEKIGKAASKSYRGGTNGIRVRWEYLGITDLVPIYEQLEDGAEIAWTERWPRKLGILKKIVRSRRVLEGSSGRLKPRRFPAG